MLNYRSLEAVRDEGLGRWGGGLGIDGSGVRSPLTEKGAIPIRAIMSHLWPSSFSSRLVSSTFARPVTVRTMPTSNSSLRKLLPHRGLGSRASSQIPWIHISYKIHILNKSENTTTSMYQRIVYFAWFKTISDSL